MCRGNTNSFLKYFGRRNNDRPNAKDLKDAETFTRNLNKNVREKVAITQRNIPANPDTVPDPAAMRGDYRRAGGRHPSYPPLRLDLVFLKNYFIIFSMMFSNRVLLIGW